MNLLDESAGLEKADSSAKRRRRNDGRRGQLIVMWQSLCPCHQVDRRSHFESGKNPDLHFLIVIPTNGVCEAESAGLDKADSSASTGVGMTGAANCDVARSLTLP